ncbi:Swt1 family HEPN domain-containing protein [Thermogemmatispora sp.]|uniref:Swt1 family HEPN domain-containing protein n=1 Tax=Thermogemmatispora sp. TaxID=1968838 RepID=UPI0035E42913
MARTNHEYVGLALTLLRDGLKPFVERQMEAVYGSTWSYQAAQSLNREHLSGNKDHLADVQALLVIIWDHWKDVFQEVLGYRERALVSELRQTRNEWAHQAYLSTDDAYRAFDSAQRLLEAISAHSEAKTCEEMKHEIMRQRYEDQLRRQARQQSNAPDSSFTGLLPWREVIQPRQDVIDSGSGAAEFAANLATVHSGQGPFEYRDPREFFQRTYLTEGLRWLLLNALRRLSDKGGDPIINLQTNFGGGKTHSLLALYHLFSGRPASELVGVETLLAEARLDKLPSVQRAVLVGHAISPGEITVKPDGCRVHTLWGELAWQLLGKDGYERVADLDRQGISPSSGTLSEILSAAAPCLILIDEWVVHLRQLYKPSNLPAGTFDANLSFAQALSEAVSSTSKAMLVTSLPASDSEAGGEGGQEALRRLKMILWRLESPWHPASVEESFEIVRRRLFQDLSNPKQFSARDFAARTFARLYQEHQTLPSYCRENGYEERIKRAYPIHPELFDRLYGTWSSLEGFQRTRGVLRLMAQVVRTLWIRGDSHPLIMPGTLPLDEPLVQDELLRNLTDNWRPIIDKDIDGIHALATQLDAEYPNLGQHAACRRVARTIYIGTAPSQSSPNRGLTEGEIQLGSLLPRENISILSDALHHLSNRSTHLWSDGQRYWYDTHVSITRLASERAARLPEAEVEAEIERRLRTLLSPSIPKGSFSRVHPCPSQSSDVPDINEGVRLVILRPDSPYTTSNEESKAYKQAQNFLNEHGNGRRDFRNTLVFLAPDHKRLEELKEAVRHYLAWSSICQESETLNLDLSQLNQAKAKRQSFNETVDLRIVETYIWLLVPEQEQPLQAEHLEKIKLTISSGAKLADLVSKASTDLEKQGHLLPTYAGTLLRRQLDAIPLWQGNHVGVGDLVNFYGRYLYLPRIKDPKTLLQAIANGVSSLQWRQETFAYADFWDETRQRYVGLKAGQIVPVTDILHTGLVVKSEVAAAQLEAEAQKAAASAVTNSPSANESGASNVGLLKSEGSSARQVPTVRDRAIAEPRYSRFHGAVNLSRFHLFTTIESINKEVIEHLSRNPNAQVKITLEIQATLPEGFSEGVRRTVEENCHTLKFEDAAFESE